MAGPSFSAAGHEDAVCQNTNWDNYTFTREASDEAEAVATAHVVFSSISAVCCLLVLGVSFRWPSFRKFPANMLLWKTACDLVTSLILVSINSTLLSFGTPDHLATGQRLCSNGLLAGLTGVCLLASPSWFFALAYNLNRSLHDPFTRPLSRMPRLHLWVWSTSLAVGISIGFLHEYRPNLHMCWSCHGLPPLFNWLLLFGWILIYWCLAALIMADAYYWMVHSRRVTERLSSRSAQLRSSILYVGIIGIQWLLAAITFGLIFEPNDKWEESRFPPSRLSYRILFAAVLGLLGVTDAASWLATSLPALHEMRLRHRLDRLLSVDDVASRANEPQHPAGPRLDSAAIGGADDPASRARSKLPLWHGHHQLTSAERRAAAKSSRNKQKDDLGDVSEALRREFVQFAVAGVASSLRNAASASATSSASTASAASGPSAESYRSANGGGGSVHGVRGGEVEMQPSGGGGGDAQTRKWTRSFGMAWREGDAGRPAVMSGALSSGARPSEAAAQQTAQLPPEGRMPGHAFTYEPRVELAPNVFFRDLAPGAFHALRSHVFGLSDDAYIRGLTVGDHRRTPAPPPPPST